jgi:hypothetical protein
LGHAREKNIFTSAMFQLYYQQSRSFKTPTLVFLETSSLVKVSLAIARFFFHDDIQQNGRTKTLIKSLKALKQKKPN